MILDAQSYPAARATCDAAAAYAERIMSEGGAKRVRHYLTAEEAADPVYAACSNEMRSAVEAFEFLRDLPAKYGAYLTADASRPSAMAVTTWTGQTLAKGRVLKAWKTPKGDPRVSGEASVTDPAGRVLAVYRFSGEGAGMFCRLARKS